MSRHIRTVEVEPQVTNQKITIVTDGQRYLRVSSVQHDLGDDLGPEFTVPPAVREAMVIDETMIFECDWDGEPSSWHDLHCIRPGNHGQGVAVASKMILERGPEW